MTLTERLRIEKGPLTLRVVDEMYVDPFWDARYGTRGRFHSEQDLAFHVDYVVEALEANDPGVMERYARWLQSVLTVRGMCTLHLADSFGRLAIAIGDARTSAHLDAARAALLYDGGTARAVQERIHEAITTGTPGTTDDVAYHLAYLADALALGQPSVFVGHMTWLAGFLRKQGRDAHALTSTLEALQRTLEEGQAQAILGVALRELA